MRMSDLWPSERANRLFARGVLTGVQVLLMILIVIGLLDLFYLLIRRLGDRIVAIDSVGELQHAMQHGFAGILLILIGLELIETVRAYVHEQHVRLEIVLIVATIAVGRHILEIDLQATDGATLAGIAALTLALTTGYFLIRKSARGKRDAANGEHGESA
jgi:uncharacterized membrane protein (DUF373 family)